MQILGSHLDLFQEVRSPENFVETFPDDRKENLYKVMRALKETGFDGPASPDHALHIIGDTQRGHRCWAYAIGHMRGPIEAIESSL